MDMHYNVCVKIMINYLSCDCYQEKIWFLKMFFCRYFVLQSKNSKNSVYCFWIEDWNKLWIWRLDGSKDGQMNKLITSNWWDLIDHYKISLAFSKNMASVFFFFHMWQSDKYWGQKDLNIIRICGMGNRVHTSTILHFWWMPPPPNFMILRSKFRLKIKLKIKLN